MEINHIALNEVDSQGHTFFVSGGNFWAESLKEYHVPCRIVEPVRAEVRVLPQKDGCLLRGTVKSMVTMPCNRCMEDALVVLEQNFDEFEPYPRSNETEPEGSIHTDFLERGVIEMERGVPFLDLEALLWEEFALALPVKPLCRPDCKGLCPACGKNLNEGDCECFSNSGDPRFAVLRQLKMKR